MGQAIGLAALAGAAYLLLVLVSPLRRCPDCHGRKVVQRGTRVRPCDRCRATGETGRLGAVIVHRAVVEHAWPWIRDRIHDRAASLTDDSTRDEP